MNTTPLRSSLLFLVAASSLLAADPELTNYKSGISLTWGVGDGSDKGTAYMEEYLYSDKIISDRKVVYIKDTTQITATHNAYNNVAYHNAGTNGPKGYFRVIGADGLDGVPNSGDEGIIRYRVDREGVTFFREWTNYGAKAVWPQLTTTTFAAMTYEGTGEAVVGTTGIVSGSQRGIVDATGDEWHVISVGDDDRQHETEAAGVKSELQASDGKTYVFVVNPKTPGITVRATGNAQFYTTPPKAYLGAKIHAQTSYIQPGSGTVTFELRNIYGGNISYKINGGSTVNVGSNSVILSDSAFSSGSNTLDYWYTSTPSVVKTRTIVKNPTHPSLTENHGHFLWGNQAELNKIIARLTRAPYASTWSYVQSAADNTYLNLWDANGMSPHRNPFFESGYLYRVPLPAPQQNTAFVGLVLGFNSIPKGKSKTWGQYAKEQLLNGMLSRIDPVDFERNQSNGANPSAEILGAGYYQINHAFSSAVAYDILAGHYRSDQLANGLTPIEDYFIRDILATVPFQEAHYLLLGAGGDQDSLWSGSRVIGATMVAMCMSEYSTPYYGTSGFGTIQNRYTFTPHPTFSPTWKEMFSTTSTTYIPGTDRFIMQYENASLWRDGGIWGGPNLGYFSLMNPALQILLNISARYSPSSSYPIINQGLTNAVNGTLTTIAKQPPSYIAQPLMANAYFPVLGPLASAAMKSRNEESTVLRDYRLLGLVWYDDGSSTQVTVAPSNGKVSITVTPP